MSPDSLAKIDQHLRENEFLRIDPPEGYILQTMYVEQPDEYALPYFSFGWGAVQGEKPLGASWWVTMSLPIGLNAVLSIL